MRMKRSEQRPRALTQPDQFHDEFSHDSPTKPLAKSYSRPHGNAKPQEPNFMAPKIAGMKGPRIPGHIHPKPWTMSTLPGKKENPKATNPFHRVWLIDCTEHGKFTTSSMKAHFAERDKALFALKPHDEKFAVGANMKFWTHLEEQGSKPGGQHKLTYIPGRKEGNGNNPIKYGLYDGRYSNVKHAQLINRTGFKNDDGEKEELHVDRRPRFDTQLKDDNIKANEDETKWAMTSSYDVFRPKHTKSCPQIGVDFLHR
eukprot:gnl/TRDRNA2_/TRDRNA2_44394_c0_seq1.p1 gnl/TRDRNA2_/TRDRNA2_44394_c0~~gnl/TRDRNA2_/TRDRNA2_44394_c0_seq1.p1  ORF type:complete len:257 (+),score=51.23 gnl/TRDRNA2_/TRDRNA2_44394_c0_seq1:1-771(+)